MVGGLESATVFFFIVVVAVVSVVVVVVIVVVVVVVVVVGCCCCCCICCCCCDCCAFWAAEVAGSITHTIAAPTCTARGQKKTTKRQTNKNINKTRSDFST